MSRGFQRLAPAALALLASLACDAEAPSPAPAPSPRMPAAEAPPEVGPPWFEECARERGLVFEHVSGHEDAYLFPEIMGGGAALADLDGDGDLDAYLVQSGSLTEPGNEAGGNRLFTNTGGGRFADATRGDAAERGYGMGVAAGDANGDGHTDLYVTNVGANALLLNDGGATLTDATSAAGVGDPGWGVSAAFFDAENDGDLDLFVVNYVFWSIADELQCRGQADPEPDYCSPKSYDAPAPDTFYRNGGDGAFVDASADAGIRTAFGNGLGVLCADFDRDGFTDVFVANDGTVNQLWRNESGARFRDVAVRAGVAVDEHGTAKAGMGVCAADLDDDGDEDLLVVNLERESDSFYRNDGDFFSDRTAIASLAVTSRPFTRFGVGLHDFDDDGNLDLFQGNGRVSRSRRAEGPDPYAEPNLLLRGSSDGRFDEVLPRGGTARAHVATSRGTAFGDVDGDGGLDVLIVNRDAPAHLFRNVVDGRGGWNRFRALDEAGADALGAVLSIRLGERTIHRTVRSAYSYAAASDAAVHVGLGDAGPVLEVTVLWPDGARERFPAPEPGTSVDLRRGSGTALER